MGEERPLVEHWLDVAVYAPIGLLTFVTDDLAKGAIPSAPPDLPALVRRGRDRAEQRIQVYRFFGQMTVAYAKAEAAKRRQAAQPVPESVHDVVPDVIEVVAPVDHLDPPFEGYDTLAAVHVIERLRRLDADQREQVYAYEAAHRNRRTILGKIDQMRR